VGRWFDFVAPPPLFFVFLFGTTAAYLGLVEVIKGLFYCSTRNAKSSLSEQL
jgi:Mg2+-importing ATPase